MVPTSQLTRPNGNSACPAATWTCPVPKPGGIDGPEDVLSAGAAYDGAAAAADGAAYVPATDPTGTAVTVPPAGGGDPWSSVSTSSAELGRLAGGGGAPASRVSSSACGFGSAATSRSALGSTMFAVKPSVAWVEAMLSAILAS